MNQGFGLITPIGRTIVRGLSYDVVAELQADYHSGTSCLEMTMACFLQPQGLLRRDVKISASWLPPVRRDVKQCVPAEHSATIARGTFHGWCSAIREIAGHSKS